MPTRLIGEKVIGKPCARKGHARFDEGMLEIGYGRDGVTLPEETGRNRENRLRPVATTPAFYSPQFPVETL